MKKALLTTLLLVILTGAYLAYYTLHILPKDMKKYEKIMKKKNSTTSKKEVFKPIKQYRKNVTKNIWKTQGSSRLQTTICANHSTLKIQPSKNESIDIEEQMEDICCYTQEKLYQNEQNSPMQEVKSFKARQGCYSFTSQHFYANEVKLNFFKIPGHLIPPFVPDKNSFLSGVAKCVSFSFSESGPLFQAEKFHATMQSIEEL